MPQPLDFDLYEALEVSRTATLEDIKLSYRRLALLHHPDKNPSDHEATERFQKIGAAYECLSDAARREAYDNPRRRVFLHGAGPFYEDNSEEKYEYHYGYTSGSHYYYNFFEEFMRSRSFGQRANDQQYSQRTEFEQHMYEAAVKTEERAVQLEKERSATRKKQQEERLQKEMSEEATRQAKIDAKKSQEEAAQRAIETKDRLEKEAQERRWALLNARTDVEKKAACLHSHFWPKEQMKRKFKCESCGKKGGMLAHKCPHCSLLACQVCLQMFSKLSTKA